MSDRSARGLPCAARDASPKATASGRSLKPATVAGIRTDVSSPGRTSSFRTSGAEVKADSVNVNLDAPATRPAAEK